VCNIFAKRNLGGGLVGLESSCISAKGKSEFERSDAFDYWPKPNDIGCSEVYVL
jgi:hypothetical protein